MIFVQDEICEFMPAAYLLSWHNRCYFVPFVKFISGAKFKEHCFNISRDIFDGVLYCLSETTYEVITSLICIIQKLKYL